MNKKIEEHNEKIDKTATQKGERIIYYIGVSQKLSKDGKLLYHRTGHSILPKDKESFKMVTGWVYEILKADFKNYKELMNKHKLKPMNSESVKANTETTAAESDAGRSFIE